MESRATVCLTGAGISTESGIPDFRSKGGIWDRFDPKDFDIRRWLVSEDIQRRYWKVAQDGYNLVRNALPSGGHFALAKLSQHNHLDLLVTQNTDGLHQKASHDLDKIVELHGTSHACVCVGCGAKLPRPEVHTRVQSGEAIPKCEDCGCLLKPDAVFSGRDWLHKSCLGPLMRQKMPRFSWLSVLRCRFGPQAAFPSAPEKRERASSSSTKAPRVSMPKRTCAFKGKRVICCRRLSMQLSTETALSVDF